MPLSIHDLPVDILLLIFPLLDAASFLNLTATCKALHKPFFLNDSTYWSSLVRHDFRVPNQPVAANDGARWHKLYRRLATQSRAFTWGNNDGGCLGHGRQRLPGRSPSSGSRQGHRAGWPGAMQGTEALGPISDLQSGGWSTSLLTAKGAIYTVGRLGDNEIGAHDNDTLAPLEYPQGFPKPTERYEPSTAIRQFSVGRSHILALADSGRIWAWRHVDCAGLHIKFLSHDTVENGKTRGRGAVRKVVAGWSKSAALIEGVGIVVWTPEELDPENSQDTSVDTWLVLNSVVVPNTNFVANDASRSSNEASLATTIGEVQDFAVLETAIVFHTTLGKAFAARIDGEAETLNVSTPVELPIQRPSSRDHSNSPDDSEASFVTSVQGSFRSFAVFTRSGAVLTSSQDHIMPLLQNQPAPSTSLFSRIPALQNNGVISIAFGDYHYHALHSSGRITSYGHEPRSCGALGLGGPGHPELRLRGIRIQGFSADGCLIPHAYTTGRQVWFEEEKRRWIQYITSGGLDEVEAAPRMQLALGTPNAVAHGELSEWIEQQGRDWEEKYDARAEDDGLGAYFALSVTAAGWHSGALVLVNDDVANTIGENCEVHQPRTTQDQGKPEPSSPSSSSSSPPPPPTTSWLSHLEDYARFFLGMAPYNASQASTNPALPDAGQNSSHADRTYRHLAAWAREGVPWKWAQDSFPRLRLSDGTEMPGTVPFDQWRYGRPDFKLDQNDWN